jgi:hypothetical protein
MGTLRLTDATASLRSGARDIKSHNLPAIVGQNDHHIQQPKRYASHDEHDPCHRAPST